MLVPILLIKEEFMLTNQYIDEKKQETNGSIVLNNEFSPAIEALAHRIMCALLYTFAHFLYIRFLSF